MSTLMIIGSSVGLLLGLLHGRGVYARRVRDAGGHERVSPIRVRVAAAYGAIWTTVLWTLFGTYVLVLWLVSVPLWLGTHAFGRPSLPTAEARS